MLTLLLAVVIMVGVWAGLHFGSHMGGWSIGVAILVGIGFLAAVSFWIRKRVEALVNGIQTRITERGQAVRRKYEQRGGYGGNVRYLMDQARRDQDAILAEALESTGKLDPYRRWSLLLGRQINALRVQFFFQMKKFDEVDRLLPKAMLANALLSCMKMCRQFQRGEDEALHRTYEVYRKRFKYDAALVYATYAWMLVRRKKIDEAIKVLLDGKKATEDETLERNWECLVNGKIGQFSNAGLGEPWYALLLEEPKQPKPTVVRQMRPGQRWRRR